MRHRRCGDRSLLGTNLRLGGLLSGTAGAAGDGAGVYADFIEKGNAALAGGDLRGAEARFIYALNIGGPNADAYCGLARAALLRGQREQARRLVGRCLQLAPGMLGPRRWAAVGLLPHSGRQYNCRPNPYRPNPGR